MGTRRSRVASRGFTLLEVILALALAVLVMMLIGIAVDTHVTLATAGRDEVEEAQLARALLRQISEDLHSAILYSPQDMSGMTSMMQGLENLPTESLPDDVKGALNSATGGAVGAGGQGTGGSQSATSSGAGAQGAAKTGSQAGGGSTTGSSTSGAATAEDAASTDDSLAPSIPGLYGDATQLQIDVSRLPRIDEYETMVQGGAGLRDVPSDVKTVTYYMGDSATPSSTARSSEPTGGGLVRRSLDRAVTEWAMANGGLEQTVESAGLIAPQVTGLSFAYFDGTEWTDTWDSELDEGLPLAVEVVLVISARPRQGVMARTAQALSLADSAPVRETVYRQVVHLPAADVIPDAAAIEGDATGEAAATEEQMP